MGYEKSLDEIVAGLRPRMKGLMICLSHSWGGLEQVAAYDCQELAELGLPIRAMVLDGSPIHENLSKHPGVQIHALHYRPRDYFDFRLKRDLHELIDADDANLVHLHQTTLLGSVSPWLYAKKKVPLFASRHIMNNHDKRNVFHHFIYRRLDALIVMSQALKRNVIATHPLRERQVKVVNLGLDFDRFDSNRVDAERQRAEWGADPETIVIGLVGRIDPAKGQATFIQAAAGLMKRLPATTKLKFVIVGEETLGATSNYLAELKKMVSQFRLEEKVIFAGFQQNIPEIMQAFDLFVMPSKQEAFGLVAIEAMAMECPIIISSGGSAEEIVGRELYGLTMRPEDAFDLQMKLKQLIENEKLRREMGKRARAHVMKHYDRKLRVKTTLQLYDRGYRRRIDHSF